MSLYAERTTVPVERSKAQIERLLRTNGATEIATLWSQGERALVCFRIAARSVRLHVPMPSAHELERTPAGRRRPAREIPRAIDQEERRRWRCLALFLRAKLEAVALGLSSFDEEFLANIMTDDGQTVGDILIPQLERALTSGRALPRLLPAHEEP